MRVKQNFYTIVPVRLIFQLLTLDRQGVCPAAGLRLFRTTDTFRWEK